MSAKTQNSVSWEGKSATQVIGEIVSMSESFLGNKWRLGTLSANAEYHCWKAVKAVSLGEPDLVSIVSFKQMWKMWSRVLMTA